MHWLLIALSLALLYVGFSGFYLHHVAEEKVREDDLARAEKEIEDDLARRAKEESKLRQILDPLEVPREVKRAAWNGYRDARSPEQFRSYSDSLNIPTDAKRKLWELKFARGWPAVSEPTAAATTPGIGALPQSYQVRMILAARELPKLRTLASGLRDLEFWFDEAPGLLLLGVGVALLLKVRPRRN